MVFWKGAERPLKGRQVSRPSRELGSIVPDLMGLWVQSKWRQKPNPIARTIKHPNKAVNQLWRHLFACRYWTMRWHFKTHKNKENTIHFDSKPHFYKSLITAYLGSFSSYVVRSSSAKLGKLSSFIFITTGLNSFPVLFVLVFVERLIEGMMPRNASFSHPIPLDLLIQKVLTENTWERVRQRDSSRFLKLCKPEPGPLLALLLTHLNYNSKWNRLLSRSVPAVILKVQQKWKSKGFFWGPTFDVRLTMQYYCSISNLTLIKFLFQDICNDPDGKLCKFLLKPKVKRI